MSYAQLSDDLMLQLEESRVSRDARLLYVEATIYCATALTDGRINVRLERFSDALNPMALAEELMKAGFWEWRANGFFVVAYLAHNRPRDEVELSKAKNRERKERSRKHQLGDHSLCLKWCPHAVTGSVTGPVTRDETPTQPIPSQPTQRVGMGKGNGARRQSEETATHAFVDDGSGITCVQCGLDVRNGVHARQAVSA